MSMILNIDTSIETASVSIAKDGVILTSVKNAIQKEHATFLHLAIQEVLKTTALELAQMDAIAVTKGPGSYTGLRVGMATAKGLCYATKKPFITIGTLEALATASLTETKEITPLNALICPMIDARRMEVYTAVFDREMNEIMPPCAMILNEQSFVELLQNKHIIFTGSAVKKWQPLVKSAATSFLYESDITAAIGQLSYFKFIHNEFSDLIYTDPLYIKDFFSA